MRRRSALIAFVGLMSLPAPSQAADALSEWNSLPPDIYKCMKKLTEAVEKAPIERVIAAGISPNHPNYAPAMTTCRTYANLRPRFECDLKDANGNAIHTLCKEYFVVNRGGKWTPVTRDEALDIVVSKSGEVRTYFEELPEGLKRREEAIRQQLQVEAHPEGVAPDANEQDEGSEGESVAEGASPGGEGQEQDKEQVRISELFASLKGEWCGIGIPLKLDCTWERGCEFVTGTRATKPWTSLKWSLKSDDTLYVERTSVDDLVGTTTWNCGYTLAGEEMSYSCVSTTDSQVLGQKTTKDDGKWARCDSKVFATKPSLEQVAPNGAAEEAINTLFGLTHGSGEKSKVEVKGCRQLTTNNIGSGPNSSIVLDVDFRKATDISFGLVRDKTSPSEKLWVMRCTEDFGDDAEYVKFSNADQSPMSEMTLAGEKSGIPYTLECFRSSDRTRVEELARKIVASCRSNTGSATDTIPPAADVANNAASEGASGSPADPAQVEADASAVPELVPSSLRKIQDACGRNSESKNALWSREEQLRLDFEKAIAAYKSSKASLSESDKSDYVKTQKANRRSYLALSNRLIQDTEGSCEQFAELLYGRVVSAFGWLDELYPGDRPCCMATVSSRVLDFADNEIDGAIALKPTDKLFEYRADLHTQRDDKDAALSDYNKALELNPSNWSVLDYRARLYWLMGRYDDAVADANDVISHTSDPEILESSKATLSAATQSGGQDRRANATSGSSGDGGADGGTYEAVLSCGMGGGENINILACFAKSGAYGSDTDLSITRSGAQRLYKIYELANLRATDGRPTIQQLKESPDGMMIGYDGLHILLPEHFAIRAQNSQEHLVLGVKITKFGNSELVYQQEVGHYDVISVGN